MRNLKVIFTEDAYLEKVKKNIGNNTFKATSSDAVVVKYIDEYKEAVGGMFLNDEARSSFTSGIENVECKVKDETATTVLSLVRDENAKIDKKHLKIKEKRGITFIYTTPFTYDAPYV